MKDCFEIAQRLQSAPEPSPCTGMSCPRVVVVCVVLAAEPFQPRTHEYARSWNTDAGDIDNAYYNEVGANLKTTVRSKG